MVEAKGQYQIVVDEYIKRGKIREAGDALKKMADIDPVRPQGPGACSPTSTPATATRKRRSRSTSRSRRSCTKKGHLAEALQVLEKGLRSTPRACGCAPSWPGSTSSRRTTTRPIQCLEEATRQRAPDDPEVQIRLGEAYLGAKRIAEAEGIFKRLLAAGSRGPGRADPDGPGVPAPRASFDQAFDQFLPVVDSSWRSKEGEKARRSCSSR